MKKHHLILLAVVAIHLGCWLAAYQFMIADAADLLPCLR